MALPLAWVDKIFMKMTLIYGREFIGRWEGIEVADVKTDWAHEMSGFENWPEAIAWGLQNLPHGKPLTVLEFRALCYKAPKPDRPQLPEPAARVERVAEELKKLRPITEKPIRDDGREWARRIVAKHEGGAKVAPCTLRMAREALAALG